MDPYYAGLRRERAVARLRMYEGLAATLAAMGEYRRLLTAAARCPEERWQLLDWGEPRETVLADGRAALLRAAGVSRRRFDAMGRYSAGQAVVLLHGSAELGIETDWQGWSG